MISRRHQRGYLVITVVVALFLLATISVMLTHGSAISANTASSELEGARAELVAQAGMQHALWRAANNACMGNVTIPATTLGADSYSASVSGAAAGSFFSLSADQDAWIRSDQTDSNNGAAASNHVRQESGKVEQVLTRFDLSSLPANAQINSAVAWFRLKTGKSHPEGLITVHEIADDWAEATVTWDSFGGAYRAGIIGMIPAQDTAHEWVAVNLTGQVQAWVNGQPNFGILFDSRAEGLHTEYLSREDGASPPRLEVVVGSGAASPVTVQATGTLAGGNTRTLQNPDVTARQSAATIEFQPDATGGVDTYIWEWNKNTNFGTDDEIWVSQSNNNTSVSLLKFPISQVPALSQIKSAVLSLHHRSGNNSNVPITAHRITAEWDEDTATWNNREAGQAWAIAGGDFDSRPVATAYVGPGTFDRHEWDIATLVQDWVDGRYENHGVALATSMQGSIGERFDTSDHTDPTRRPRLTITYSCECGSPCMSAQGSGKIALIGDDSSPDPDDKVKIAVFESWGYDVDFYEDRDSDSINWNNYDMAYVSETAIAGDVSANLVDAPIGIVTEEPNLYDDLRLAGGNTERVGAIINIADNSHFITSVYQQGPLSIYTGNMEILTANTPLAADLQVLAQFGGEATLTAIEKGTQTLSGTAAGRRVTLPLGQHFAAGFDWGNLNYNGHLLLQRSIAWAMRADYVPSGDLLMVVGNDGNLTTQELTKQALLESWGYTVNVIDEDDPQAAFDTAFAANDVVFVTEDVNANDINIKLTGAPIGVVTEEANLVDDLGMGDGIAWDSGNKLDVVDNSHYIMQPFAMGTLGILNSNESLAYQTPNLAPDLMILANSDSGPGVNTIESGAELVSGLPASGRRVLLPWGGNNMDVNSLNEDGLTVFRRSLEWAAGAGPKYGLIAHWKLDEDSGLVAEDSAGGHDGTLANGPAWVPAIHGGGLSFDGDDDAIVVPNDSTLALVNKMTFAAWVRSDNFGQSGPYDLVVSKGTVATTYAYYFGALGNEIIFGFSDGIYREFVTPDLNLATDTWHHIAATYDNANDQVRLYHNGTEVLAATTTYEPTPTSHDLYIGSSEDGADWDGELDDVRIYRDVLSADEIAELAALPPRLPIAHWKLDETSGTTAVDSAGGHDGTLANGPVWTSGHIDNALSFDGSNDRINVPHDNELNLTSQLTLSAWVYSESLDGFRMVLTKGNNGVPENYWLGTDRDGVNFGFVDGGTYAQYTTSGLNLRQDQWHHIAATFNNATNEVKLYLDGSVETFSSTYSPASNTENLIIGSSYYAGESFDGLIDDVRIYNVVLDDAEIAALASAGGSNFGGGGGGAQYIEANQLWWPGSADTWETVDLSAYGVPGNAVVEVAVMNNDGGRENWVGARAVGSNLERRLQLHEAEGGGNDVVTMHVQADSGGRIQTYADRTNSIAFTLLGYWTGVTYVELFDSVTAGASNAWVQEDVSNDGLGPNQVAEIAMLNSNQSRERLAGVRATGSSYQRRFNLHEAESGGVEAYSMMVVTDPSSTIEVFAQSASDIEFVVLGYWSSPPGTYVENGVGAWNASSTNWETINLSSVGVPANAVLQVTSANLNQTGERQMGVRSTGSSLDRHVDLQEAEAGGSDRMSWHVRVDGSSNIQSYSETSGAAYLFAPVGWWVLQ